MYELSEFGFAQMLERVQCRHQRVLDVADFSGDRRDVNVFDFRMTYYFLRGLGGNDP